MSPVRLVMLTISLVGAAPAKLLEDPAVQGVFAWNTMVLPTCRVTAPRLSVKFVELPPLFKTTGVRPEPNSVLVKVWALVAPVAFLPSTEKVPPLRVRAFALLTRLVGVLRLAKSNVNVPARKARPPLKVFVAALLSVKVPGPTLVRPKPEPLTTPGMVNPPEPTTQVWLAPNARLMRCAEMTSPIVTAPPPVVRPPAPKVRYCSKALLWLVNVTGDGSVKVRLLTLAEEAKSMLRLPA